MANITELPSGSFRVQIRRKGIGYTAQTFKSRVEAEEWARSRESELLANHHKAVPRVSEGLSFSDLAERYFTSPVFTNKAATTQSRERSTSKRLLQHFGRYAVSVIDSAMVQDYLDLRATEYKCLPDGTRTKQRVSGDTVRLEKALLSQLFKFAKRRKLAAHNIMLDSFDLPTCTPREGRITLQQQLTLFNAANELALNPRTNSSLLPWLCFVFETGTRPGEAAKVELAWCDLEERKVAIPRVGQKKRNARIVLLHDDLCELLHDQFERARAAGSKYLFFSRGKEPAEKDERGQAVRRRRTKDETAARAIKPFAYYSSWRRLCDRAGIPAHINPHIIRHEFISRLFENTDLNDGQIAALVGDVNVLSLEPYKHLRVERLRGRQDAHMDELREAMRKLEEQKGARLSAHVRRVLEEGQREREAAGDHSTPMDRIRAAVKARELLERIQDGVADEEE